MYPLGVEAKHLVDEIFDKMQRFGRLKYTISHIFFSFSVFIIYKINAKEEAKRRVIVNIRKLNNLVIADAYPLSLQLDIIANVQECTNLAVLDTILFFYQ